MKKIYLFWFAILAFLLLGCRNEDFSNSIAESKREEEFFRNNNENTNSKNFNASLVSSTISKLKNLNDMTDFISKLSDKTGLPAWNYIAKSKIKTANKGGDGGQVLIVPLKVEEGFLSSLMYVKNADSSDPTVYTVTNEQLKDFAEDKSIDNDTRESVLRTFITFDNAMFGSRLYSSIPADLFDNVPLKENHDHKSFAIGQHEPTQNLDVEQCFMTFHCKNQMEESRCDMCWKCVSITCPLGGGTTVYEPDFPNSPGGNGDGGSNDGGQTNPGIPWYLQNPDIDIFSYSPIVQSVFQSLTDYGIVLHVSQVDFLQQNSTIAQRFRTYLASDNSLVKSQNANMGINFFMDNPGATWQDFLNQVQKTPCENIKTSTGDAKYQPNITNLQGKTSLSYESGFRLGTPVAGSGQSGTQNQILQNKPGTKEVDMKIFNNTFALMHSHYDGLIPIFSPGDVLLFNQWIVWAKNYNDNPSTNPKIPINNLTLTLVTSNGNYLLAFDGTATTAFPAYTPKQMDDLNNDYINDYLSQTQTNGNFDMIKVEKEFLKFVKDNMNMTGLKFYKVKSDGNYEISLTNLAGTKCP
jgi:hypothetical protein